jgi:hypothetical protein
MAGPSARVAVPATQDTPDKTSNTTKGCSAKIKKATDQFIKHPHLKEGKEEEIPWKAIAEELRRRLLLVGGTQANEQTPTPSQELKDIKESINELQKAVQSIVPPHSHTSNTQKPQTWASVAASNAPPQRDTSAPPLQKAREIIVRLDEPTDTQNLQRKSTEQIMQNIRQTAPSQYEQIASIRRLPSGDIAVRAITVEARQELEKSTEWTKGLADSSRVIRKTCAVFAHGVRTALDTSNQEATIAKLKTDNARLHPGLDIIRVAWPRKVEGSGKGHSSLIVEVATEEMANRLIDYGLIESYSECACEYFEKECRITQCFICFKFGHTAKACQSDPDCHRCGGHHHLDDCMEQEERMFCPNCKKEGHKPWMRRCPFWKAAIEKANFRFNNRPHRFPNYREPREPPRSRSAHTANSSPSLPTDASSQDSRWIRVENRKRKASIERPRRVGRPKALDAPIPNNQLTLHNMASTQ